MAIISDNTTDEAQMLERTNHPDNAEPNHTGCRCSCPECQADHCLYCWDDGLARA